ncbi:MAG: hypothetical protein WC346_00360 [Methanogenium sp.]|jgi:hypothetical protein
MENVDMKVVGDKLVLTVDLSKQVGPSASGKSITIGSTKGNVSVPGKDGISVGLNVYKKK